MGGGGDKEGRIKSAAAEKSCAVVISARTHEEKASGSLKYHTDMPRAHTSSISRKSGWTRTGQPINLQQQTENH